MATTLDMPVLDRIFKTLQRLETQVDSQSNRLNAIELSIKSRSSDIAASSTDESSSETSNSGFSHHGQSRSSAGSMNTPSSHCPRSPAASYKASVAELRNRFEFSDSSSDVGAPPARPPQPVRGDGMQSPAVNDRDEGNDDEWEDEVVYTESAYSQYPSRLDLSNLADVPPLPNDIQLQRYVHGAEPPINPPTLNEREDASSPPGPLGRRQPSDLDGPHRLQPGSPPANVSATSTAKCARCGHQAGSEQETNSQTAAQETGPAEKPSQWRVLVAQRHDQAEMALFAWECFKASLRSSWWFESEERRAIQSETRRITKVLAPASAAAASSPSRKAREAAGKLKTMLARRLSNAGFFWARRETAVVP